MPHTTITKDTRQRLFMLVGLIMTLLIAESAFAAAPGVWISLKNITLVKGVLNPLTGPDRDSVVSITNNTGEDLAGPLRLLVNATGFEVSNANDTIETKAVYAFDVLPLAKDAKTTVTIHFKGGGTLSYSVALQEQLPVSFTETPNQRSYPEHSSGEFYNVFSQAVLRADGSVVTWGYGKYGGDSSKVATQIDGVDKINMNVLENKDVVQIFASGAAYAALRKDGSVVTWGDSRYGGNSSAVASKIDGKQGNDNPNDDVVPDAVGHPEDVNKIYSSLTAFAAVRNNGSVIVWGYGSGGGKIYDKGKQDDLNGTVPVKQIFSNGNAFAALRDDGKVVTWGFGAYGGNSESVATQIDGQQGNDNPDNSVVLDDINHPEDVNQVYSTQRAFAAVRNNGSVVVWGVPAYGGAVNESVKSQLIDVKEIYSTQRAFAAIRKDGSVVVWGDKAYGGDITGVADELNGQDDSKDVVKIFSTNWAFAALRADGSVIAWGNQTNGGNTAKVALQLDGMDCNEVDPVDPQCDPMGDMEDVTDIFSTAKAFAALRKNGSVVTWGTSTYGGNSSKVAKEIDGIDETVNNVTENKDVTAIYSTRRAFAVIRKDGSVVTWGDGPYGGNSKTVAGKLAGGTDNKFVIRINANSDSFAALHKDNSVVTWGNQTDGGSSSKVSVPLKSGVVSFADIYEDDCLNPDPEAGMCSGQ